MGLMFMKEALMIVMKMQLKLTMKNRKSGVVGYKM